MTAAFEIDTRPAVLDQFVADETGRLGSRLRGIAHAAGLDVLAATQRIREPSGTGPTLWDAPSPMPGTTTAGIGASLVGRPCWA
jgi:hypothetical protein